jgi:Beta-lactamase superfamily domain
LPYSNDFALSGLLAEKVKILNCLMSYLLKPRHLFLFLVGMLWIFACATSSARRLSIYSLSKAKDLYYIPNEEDCGNRVKLSYTGCGGFWIEYENEIIVIDPYFSNQGVDALLVEDLKTDTNLVNYYFRKQLNFERDTAGKIKAVLLSHAHYDHLADLPYMLSKNLQSKKVKIYGSTTSLNLLKAFHLPFKNEYRQLVNLEYALGSWYKSQKKRQKRTIKASNLKYYYSPSRRIRFTAIPSEHAPHFYLPGGGGKIPFISGDVWYPPNAAPKKATDFKEGKNFNYLIDILDYRGVPVYRIFSNAGAGCNAGVGYPPKKILREKKIDLLLACGANYDTVDDYPFDLIKVTKPNWLFINHWENFFKPITSLSEKPEVVPNTNILTLISRLRQDASYQGYPREIIMTQPLAKSVEFSF